MGLENATDYPAFYYARHIGSGVVGYEKEVLHVPDDTLKNMMPSFLGKPVVVHHQDIELENLENKDGTVIESFYNQYDGRYWVKFIVETDKARKAIANGWGVSNCYQPTEYGSGGIHNNVKYDKCMLNGYYKHLAIVPNPRYEEAAIYTPDEFKLYNEDKKVKLTQLQNAKEDKKMISFFKTKKEEVSKIDEDTMLTLENGVDVSLKDMIAAVSNAKKEEEEEKEERINMDQEIDVNGENMPIRELINRYSKLTMKKNEGEPEKTEEEKQAELKNALEAKEREEAELKNALEAKEREEAELKNALEAKEKEAKEAKENYYKLMNATTSRPVQVVETRFTQVERGKVLYGSGK